MIRTVLTTAAVLTSLAFTQAAMAQTPAAAPAAASGSTVVVHLRGMTAGKGAAVVLLFDSEQALDANKPAQSTKIDATAATADVTFSGVAPGRYAIKAFYDINNNGAYDQGVDGIAFSNHVVMNDPSHVPTFSETSFMVRPGANTQQLTFSVAHF
jgi:uncharacterized protein (DUF2141 family)